jgi:tol-pal system protein YbgF
MTMAGCRAAKAAAAAAFTLVAMTGCFASKSELDQVREEVNTVRTETSAADSVRAMQMVQLLSSLRAVNDTLAALSVRVTRVRAESQSGMRDLHDQLVQVQEATGQSQQRLQEMRAAIDQRNRTAAPPPPPPPPAGSVPDTTTAAPADTPGPNELFQIGKDQLARGANSAARSAFADLLARYPDSELAPDAQFYLAESLAAAGKTAAADTAYATVLTKYPTSLRAATALYKRGVSQQKAGRTATAKKTFNEVIRLFPDSDEAALARERLRGMT